MGCRACFPLLQVLSSGCSLYMDYEDRCCCQDTSCHLPVGGDGGGPDHGWQEHQDSLQLGRNRIVEEQVGESVNTTIVREFFKDRMEVTMAVNNVTASSVFKRN